MCIDWPINKEGKLTWIVRACVLASMYDVDERERLHALRGTMGAAHEKKTRWQGERERQRASGASREKDRKIKTK